MQNLNREGIIHKKYDIEIKYYFERKFGEGKNKILVLNPIRSKVVSAAFAVI